MNSQWWADWGGKDEVEEGKEKEVAEEEISYCQILLKSRFTLAAFLEQI